MDTNQAVEAGTIEDVGEGFHYPFSTADYSSGAYRLKVMDGEGFTTISGPIVVKDVTVVPVGMDGTGLIDNTGDTRRTVQDTGTVYNGATIDIPAESSEADTFTLTFRLVTAGEPYILDTAAFGDAIEIKAVTQGHEITFTKAIEVTLPYGNIPNINEPKIYTFDPNLDRWVPVTDFRVDKENRTITFRTTHFSLYTLVQSEEYARQINGGTHTEDYRIFSFPCHPDTTNLLTNLESILGGYNDTIWRCFAFNMSTTGYDEANAEDFVASYPLEPGRAYWLISRDDKDLKVDGLGLNSAGPFEMTLHPGWNMVANPFNEDIDLGTFSIKVSADGEIFEDLSTTTLTDNELFKLAPQDDGQGNITWYTKMSLDPTSQDPPYGAMAPFEGYWLYNGSLSRLIMRFEPLQPVGGALDKAPLFKRMVWFARRSVHQMIDAVSAMCFAGNGGGHEPPPPPGNPGSGEGSIGTTSTASGGGCFIATAAYGSVLHPHVKILRSFRDTYLVTHGVGKRFVAFYYRYSPSVADFISGHARLKYVTRVLIIPLVAFSAFMLHTACVTKLLVLLTLMVILGCRTFRKFVKEPNPPHDFCKS